MEAPKPWKMASDGGKYAEWYEQWRMEEDEASVSFLPWRWHLQWLFAFKEELIPNRPYYFLKYNNKKLRLLRWRVSAITGMKPRLLEPVWTRCKCGRNVCSFDVDANTSSRIRDEVAKWLPQPASTERGECQQRRATGHRSSAGYLRDSTRQRLKATPHSVFSNHGCSDEAKVPKSYPKSV